MAIVSERTARSTFGPGQNFGDIWSDIGNAAGKLVAQFTNPKPAPPPPPPPAPNIFGNTTTLLLLGTVGLVGAAIYFNGRRGGGRSFSGYSRHNRRTRRTSRHAKRRS
jgi:hypothetical protein